MFHFFCFLFRFVSSVKVAANVLQLPAVGDIWHYFSNISLNFLPAQIFNKQLNRQLLVGAVISRFVSYRSLISRAIERDINDLVSINNFPFVKVYCLRLYKRSNNDNCYRRDIPRQVRC